MNFKSKILMLAKAISVWWGIYLIIGCCACFSINILLGIFGAESITKNIGAAVFIPVLAGGSLVLAVITYIVTSAAKRLPEKNFRRKLDKILREKGVCREYTSLLSEKLRGETKNSACIELAGVCLLSGDVLPAKKYIEQIDVVSVLDVAQSTGNYYTAAYYYATVAVIYLCLGNSDMAEAAFKNGEFYLRELDYDSFITAARALGQSVFGSAEEAVKTAEIADELRRRAYKKGSFNHIQGFVTGIRAHILFKAGLYDEAAEAAGEALKIKISEEFEKNITELSLRISSHNIKESEKTPT